MNSLPSALNAGRAVNAADEKVQTLSIATLEWIHARTSPARTRRTGFTWTWKREQETERETERWKERETKRLKNRHRHRRESGPGIRRLIKNVVALYGAGLCLSHRGLRVRSDLHCAFQSKANHNDGPILLIFWKTKTRVHIVHHGGIRYRRPYRSQFRTLKLEAHLSRRHEAPNPSR